MKKRIPDLLAFLLAVTAGFGNVYNIFLNFLKTPPGTQYLGTGSFYTPDYFFYLAHLVRGLKGHWQIFDRYSQDGKVGFWVIHWPYVLIGQLSRIFSLSAPEGYWLSVFILTTAIVFCVYLFLKLIFKPIGKNYLIFPVLIVYLFAGPFFLIKQNPLRIEVEKINWYYQTDFFERTSIIPHHLTSNLGVIISFICSVFFLNSLAEKKFTRRSFLSLLGLTASLGLVMSINPVKLVYLLPAFGLAFVYGIFYSKRFNIKSLTVYGILLTVLISTLFLFGLYFQKNVALYNLFPAIAAWEKTLSRWPTPKIFFLASGLVFVLAIPSLLIIFKKIWKLQIHPSIIMGILASIFSYILFFTRLALLFNTHNSRFLFPDSYLFMAIIIFMAADLLRTKRQNKLIIIGLITIVVVSFSAPAVYSVLKSRRSDHRDFAGMEYYKYLPEDFIDGLKFLDNQATSSSQVLTTTISGIGLLLPLYIEPRVYAIRDLSTINFSEKAKNTNDFFLGIMSSRQKIDLLRREKINYLIFTIYDLRGMDQKYLHKPYFITPDLPLELIFSNQLMVIYKVL